MKLCVVIPTIRGREDHFARCEKAYRDTTPEPVLFLVVRDARNWPAACNTGTAWALSHDDVDTVHYTADDLEPQPGWYEAAADALETGVCPAPFDFDGSLRSPQERPYQLVSFSRVPTLRREWAEQVGPWPEIDYYADCWLGDKLMTMQVPSRIIGGYRFTHHWAQVGRLDSPDRLEVAERLYKEELSKL